MNTLKHIKFLALFQLILLILEIISTFYFQDSLDPLLQEYLAKDETAELTRVEIALLLFSLPVLLLNLIATIAIIFQKKWAKKTYIYTLVLLIPLTFVFGATVEDAITSGLDYMLSLSEGMLFALLIYTNAYEEE